MKLRPLHLALSTIACAGMGLAQRPMQPQVIDEAIIVKEHLGDTIPLDLTFQDENGKAVKLADYFTGKRPVILNLGYYGCPGLCGALINGMTQGLEGIDMLPGKEFEIVSVSFDPTEKPKLAHDKKKSYVAIYSGAEDPAAGDAVHGGKVDLARQAAAQAHWHFLTGAKPQIEQLTKAVGFGYRWNESGRQYDHAAVLTLLSPAGKIVRYLYGLWFESSTLRLGIVEASEGKVGSTWDRILLSCYSYDPEKKTYRLAFAVMRIGGGLTVLALGTMIFLLLRRERRKSPVGHAAVAP